MASKFRLHTHFSGIISWIPLLIPFTIPFPIKANSWTLVATTICFVLWAIKHKTTTPDFLKTPLFLVMTGLFLLFAIGITYSSNLKQGLTELEKNLCLLIFPFLVFQWKKLGTRMSHLFWAFTAGCVLITFYGIAEITFTVEPQEKNKIFTLGHSYFTGYINLHPTYLSLYFIMISFFLIDLMVRRRVSGAGWLLVPALLVYAVVFIFFLRSRMVIPLLLIGTTAYFFFLNRSRWRQLSVLVVVTVALFVVFSGSIQTAINKYGRNAETAFRGRINVWRSAYEGYTMSPIFGAGTGGAQDLIDEGYLRTGHDEGLDNLYNAHNQYLQFLCDNGIFGLGVYLVLLYTLTTVSLRQNNALFFAFLTCFSFAMITESILFVQKGIVCFYFFSTCFYYLRND